MSNYARLIQAEQVYKEKIRQLEKENQELKERIHQLIELVNPYDIPNDEILEGEIVDNGGTPTQLCEWCMERYQMREKATGRLHSTWPTTDTLHLCDQHGAEGKIKSNYEFFPYNKSETLLGLIVCGLCNLGGFTQAGYNEHMKTKHRLPLNN